MRLGEQSNPPPLLPRLWGPHGRWPRDQPTRRNDGYLRRLPLLPFAEMTTSLLTSSSSLFGLRDVEPAHVRLLGTIARLVGSEGKIRRPDLESHWQASTEFLTPMLQLLAREGLIEDASNTRQGISFTGVE